MKKLIFYVIIIVLIIFLIPILFTKKFKNEENIINTEANLEEHNNNVYSKVKLLHVKTGEIEELNLDTYLLGVVSSEMPASYDMEALKAQAVVARTYTIYKMKNKKHDEADVCDDSKCCQAWISKEDRMERWSQEEKEANWGKIEKAVEETENKIIVYNNEPINAFFHANSGGITDNVSSVWGGSNYPYLQSVTTSGEENYSRI